MAVFGLALATPASAHAPQFDDSVSELHERPTRSNFRKIFRRKEPQWNGLHPALRTKLEGSYAQMRQEGYDIRMAEGYRTDERQAQLLASQTGVTQVGEGRSCHNYGMAAGSVIFKRNGPSWNLEDEHMRSGYERYGALAQDAGLRWGGSWKSFQDLPRVELWLDCRVAIRNRHDEQRQYQWAVATWEARRAEYARQQFIWEDEEWFLTINRCATSDCTTFMSSMQMAPMIQAEPEAIAQNACVKRRWWVWGA